MKKNSKSTDNLLIIDKNPAGEQWQLGRLPVENGRVVLLRWDGDPEPADAGIPAPIAKRLAHAMTRVAQVTFLSSTNDSRPALGWSALGNDFVLTPKKTFFGQLGAWAKRHPYTSSLVSTRTPGTVLQAFEDSEFPWWMQAQIILLSEASAGPPPITLSVATGLLGEQWARKVALLKGKGVWGALYPGVDGDVAGLFSVSSEQEQKIFNDLE